MIILWKDSKIYFFLIVKGNFFAGSVYKKLFLYIYIYSECLSSFNKRFKMFSKSFQKFLLYKVKKKNKIDEKKGIEEIRRGNQEIIFNQYLY